MAFPIGINQSSIDADLSSFLGREYLEQQVGYMGYNALENGAPVIISPDREALAFRFQLKLKSNAALLHTWDAVENDWGVNKLAPDPVDTITDPDLLDFLGLDGFENQYVWLLSKLQALEEAQGQNRIILIPNYSTRRLGVVATLPTNLSRAISIIINYLSGGVAVVFWGDIQGQKDYNSLVNLPDLSQFATQSALNNVVNNLPPGPQGPPGNDGAVGPQGIQGPPGNDGAVGSSFAQITGTWSTNSTSYVQLGGTDFKVSIAAAAGDKIMIIPPAVAISSFSFFRLQRNGTDILLGDAATGREQTTWGVCLSGGTSVGVFYYGSLPIGGPVIDIAPGSGTYEYSIIGRSPSGLIYLGRNVHDGGVYNNRFRSQLTVINLGQ